MQGGKGMKKVAISGIIVILVIFGIGMSYMLFRGGRRTEEEQKISEEGEKRMENLMNRNITPPQRTVTITQQNSPGFSKK